MRPPLNEFVPLGLSIAALVSLRTTASLLRRRGGGRARPRTAKGMTVLAELAAWAAVGSAAVAGGIYGLFAALATYLASIRWRRFWWRADWERIDAAVCGAVDRDQPLGPALADLATDCRSAAGIAAAAMATRIDRGTTPIRLAKIYRRHLSPTTLTRLAAADVGDAVSHDRSPSRRTAAVPVLEPGGPPDGPDLATQVTVFWLTVTLLLIGLTLSGPSLAWLYEEEMDSSLGPDPRRSVPAAWWVAMVRDHIGGLLKLWLWGSALIGGLYAAAWVFRPVFLMRLPGWKQLSVDAPGDALASAVADRLAAGHAVEPMMRTLADAAGPLVRRPARRFLKAVDAGIPAADALRRAGVLNAHDAAAVAAASTPTDAAETIRRSVAASRRARDARAARRRQWVGPLLTVTLGLIVGSAAAGLFAVLSDLTVTLAGN